VTCRERSDSPETGKLLAGTGTDGDSPRNAPPAKRRRVSEDEQSPRKNEDTALAGSTDSEPSLSARFTESVYVCWLAADVGCQGMAEESRKEFERKCADDARELLGRYKSTLGTYALHTSSMCSLFMGSTQVPEGGPG
jgi:hypothetical protein